MCCSGQLGDNKSLDVTYQFNFLCFNNDETSAFSKMFILEFNSLGPSHIEEEKKL